MIRMGVRVDDVAQLAPRTADELDDLLGIGAVEARIDQDGLALADEEMGVDGEGRIRAVGAHLEGGRLAGHEDRHEGEGEGETKAPEKGSQAWMNSSYLSPI